MLLPPGLAQVFEQRQVLVIEAHAAIQHLGWQVIQAGEHN
jgi:hypothetical protein